MTKAHHPMLTEQQLGSWRDQGFVLVRGLLEPAVIDQILKGVLAQLRKYVPDFAGLDEARSWRSDAFHARLIRLRAESPKSFGLLYDTMQTSALVQSSSLRPRIVAVAAAMLDDAPENLSATGMMLRMDAPNDRRNILNWHQERSYYGLNDEGANGVVAWLPLQDVDAEIGTISVCTGSHREQFDGVVSKGKIDGHSSEQYALPPGLLARYEPVSVAAKAGDGVFFNMNLFHASGLNSSARIRFTLGARFHRAAAADFHPGRLEFHPTSQPIEFRTETPSRRRAD